MSHGLGGDERLDNFIDNFIVMTITRLMTA